MIQVYDDFAVISFAVDSILIVIRPQIEGQYALYNNVPTDVGDVRRGTLHLSSLNKKPIAFNLVEDQTQTYTYLLNIIMEGTIDGIK